MSTQLTTTLLTPEEYLAIEREAAFKSEYIDGVMYAMTGAKYWHVQVVGNLTAELVFQLKKHPCSVLPTGIKVHVPDASKLFYPDVSVVCGEPQFHDERTDVILNPVLIVEVLSKSTALFRPGREVSGLSDDPLAARIRPRRSKQAGRRALRQTNE